MLIFNLFSIGAKLFYLVLNTLNLGKGTTFISNIYLKFFGGNISLKNFKFTKGIIFVTGTNGKTSTTKTLTQILQTLGYKVLHNDTGGNILRSIIGMFLLKNKIIFKNTYDFLVLEIDEASVLRFSKIIKPTHLLILNFSRDQLDRYFEIENISEDLLRLLNSSKKTKLIFNNEDSYCIDISTKVSNETLYFNSDYNLLKKTSFNESYMASNLSAVITTLTSLGIKYIDYEKFLKDLKKPYGRAEKIIKKGKEFELHLAKNPASFNNNLNELLKRKNLKHFLFVLNDNVPDGKDISWIYDIEPNLLGELLNKKKIYFSGTRAYEMANRIQYSTNENKIVFVNRNLKQTFNYLYEKDFNEIIILCNYSAMLEIRKILTGRSIH